MTNVPLRISACAVVAGSNFVKAAQSNRLCYKFPKRFTVFVGIQKCPVFQVQVRALRERSVEDWE